MKKFTLLSFAFCILMKVWGNAQVVIPDQNQPTQLGKTVYGLGFAAGFGTGLGVSFRHHFPSEFSYQLVGGIIKVDGKLTYDVGAEAHIDLVRGEMTRFFALGGLGYYYSGDSGNNLAGPFRVAIGTGGEFSTSRKVHVTLEGMFTFFSDGTILPLPQFSVHYYFF